MAVALANHDQDRLHVRTGHARICTLAELRVQALGRLWYSMVWYGRCLWRIAGGRSIQVLLPDRDSISRQTLRAGMCAPLPEKPYLYLSPRIIQQQRLLGWRCHGALPISLPTLVILLDHAPVCFTASALRGTHTHARTEHTHRERRRCE